MTETQPFGLDLERHRAALLRIVAVLFVYAGLDEGGADTVPRRVWRRIVRLLRPAESAVRRLIVLAARGIEVEPPKPRPQKPPTGIERLQAAGVLTFHKVNFGLARAWQPQSAEPEKTPPAIPAFPLADPPRRFDWRGWEGLRPFPKHGIDFADGDEEVSVRHLCRRLRALKRALDDIDGHARRLARREARLTLASRSTRGGFASASQAKLKDANRRYMPANRRRTLRLGHPPGHRWQPASEIDDILRECHALALGAMRADTG